MPEILDEPGLTAKLPEKVLATQTWRLRYKVLEFAQDGFSSCSTIPAFIPLNDEACQWETENYIMSPLVNTISRSYPIPEPVKALGQPEDIFPASKQRSSLGTLIGSLLAVAALLLLGICGMLLYCAVRPFGTNPPPPAVCWAAGVGLLFLAFGAVFGSYYYLSGKGDNQQSYLIFPQCLVEILPMQHRVIPWEAIREKTGTSKAAVAALRSFRFSAGPEKDIAFDSSLPRHEELAALLLSRGGKSGSSHLPASGAAGVSTSRASASREKKSATDVIPANAAHAKQVETAGMDETILANPQTLMQPMNALVQTLAKFAPQSSVLHLIADVRTENGRSSILFTHGSPLQPSEYTTLVNDNIAHASFAVIDPMLRLDALFPGFEILLRKTSPENWNVKFHRLDQPAMEFSDLPRCPLRLCGYGLSLVPLRNKTFRCMRNTNPPGVIVAACGSDAQAPAKQVQIILSDQGSQLALGPGVNKAEEVVEVAEGPDAHQWIIETPLFCAAWPNGLDLRSPLASKTRFDLVGLQPDGALLFVQDPSHCDEGVLDTMAAEGQKEVARGETSAGHAWIELRYEFQGTSWRQRHYVRRLSAKRCFVVTAQCPQAVGAMIFAAADELTNSLALPRYS